MQVMQFFHHHSQCNEHVHYCHHLRHIYCIDDNENHLHYYHNNYYHLIIIIGDVLWVSYNCNVYINIVIIIRLLYNCSVVVKNFSIIFLGLSEKVKFTDLGSRLKDFDLTPKLQVRPQLNQAHALRGSHV